MPDEHVLSIEERLTLREAIRRECARGFYHESMDDLPYATKAAHIERAVQGFLLSDAVIDEAFRAYRSGGMDSPSGPDSWRASVRRAIETALTVATTGNERAT